MNLPSLPETAKISYGPAPQQHAELRLPEGAGPFPVVVVIHGGCWVEYATAEYTRHIASALTKEGWATWNLEYRRANDEGGGFPGTFRDAVSGVDALAGAASKYHLDISKAVVIGHSAGGQLALYSAHKSKLPLRGAISLGGIVDMRAYSKGGPKDCVSGELRVMGGAPDQHPERYAEVSPAELLPLRVPHVLVWGGQDTIVPQSLFTDYEARSKAEIVRVPQANHHALCSADGPGWSQIVAAIRKLLH